jgi:branched-chain amino acid transport system permease protein
LIGAVVVYLADQLVFKALMPIGHQIVLGALLGAMILFAPEGLLSVFAKRVPWPGRGRIVAASRDA